MRGELHHVTHAPAASCACNWLVLGSLWKQIPQHENDDRWASSFPSNFFDPTEHNTINKIANIGIKHYYVGKKSPMKKLAIVSSSIT